MSLYLCVFEEDEELDGVDVGAYSDFGHLRATVANILERGNLGSRFPTLMRHSDCDGEWNLEECKKLQNELQIISNEFKQQPPEAFCAEWQEKVAKQIGLRPANLCDCFIDVDGEPLLERLVNLVKLAQRRNLPILFQ